MKGQAHNINSIADGFMQNPRLLIRAASLFLRKASQGRANGKIPCSWGRSEGEHRVAISLGRAGIRCGLGSDSHHNSEAPIEEMQILIYRPPVHSSFQEGKHQNDGTLERGKYNCERGRLRATYNEREHKGRGVGKGASGALAAQNRGHVLKNLPALLAFT